MTFGIDVSQGQSGINYNQARREGVEFVIVKASGLNTGTLYVANGYTAHVDRARAAELAIGHYFVTGKGSPAHAANYLADHLHGFDAAHDVIALDNEPLDGNADFWNQAEAMEFFTTIVRRTGIAWSRLWLYAPASLTRGGGPWDQVTNAGIRIWWSAYGNAPTGHTPDHEPSLQGKIARWDVHQYSSSVRVAGLTVDGNYSKISRAELFGGGGGSAPAGIVSGGSSSSTGRTSTEEDGDPGKIYWTKVQSETKARGWYDGAVDGDPGPKTHLAHAKLEAAILNEWARNNGRGRTSTEEDGIPGGIFWRLAQDAGREFGYTGVTDGDPGAGTLKSLYKRTAHWLNRYGR